MKKESINLLSAPIILGWLAVLLILFLPEVNNHTETEDAYEYARQLVATDSWAQLIHPNHKIYHIICDEAYTVLNTLFGIEALEALIWVSRFCAFLTLVFLNAFLLSIGVKPAKALILLGILSVVYNFWRYTQAAEINAMAWAAQSFCLLIFIKAKDRIAWVPLLAGAGCVATLVHTINIVPVVVIFGTYFFISRKFASLGVYAGLVVALTAISFISLDSYVVKKESKVDVLEAGIVIEDGERSVRRPARESMRKLDFKSAQKAVVGFGVCTVGVNALMGYDQVYYPLKESLFKERYLYEERFMAEGLPGWHQVLWGLSLIVLGGWSCWVVFVVVRGFLRRRDVPWKKQLSKHPVEISLGVGGIVSFVFILWFEPGNPEMWALLLPSIVSPLLLALSALEIKYLGITYLVLMVTNWLGGMSLLNQEQRDYFCATVMPLIADAKEGDVLVKAKIHSGITRYSNYFKPDVKVGTLHEDQYYSSRLEVIHEVLSEGRRVFVHREVVEKLSDIQADVKLRGMQLVLDQTGGGELFLAQ